MKKSILVFSLLFSATFACSQSSLHTLPVLDSIKYTSNQKEIQVDKPLWNEAEQNWEIADNKAYKDFIGWLYSYDELKQESPEIKTWADQLKHKYKYCVVLGMGGSSLSVEAMRVLFGKEKGYPELIVLDTSNPDTFLEVTKKIDLRKTLFVVSSKSGTTTETLYGYKFFFSKMENLVEKPGEHFVAITDAGSFLQTEGEQKEFLRIFLNRKDIGGRFSVLSYFGMVPAAIAGYDIKEILTSAKNYSSFLKQDPSLPLSLAEAISPRQGPYTRLFLVLDNKKAGFGLWIEQLISESLGKDGKAVIPIVVEKSNNIILTNKDVLVTINKKIAEFTSPNATEFSLRFDKGTDIGKYFLLWELAVTYAGKNMGINPFNQPDVELTKKLTKQMLSKDISVLVSPLKISSAIKRVYGDTPNISEILEKEGRNSAYITLMIYSDLDKKEKKNLSKFADTLQRKTEVPVVITYGPRYLHSLGQLHKGGANNGLFFIITDIKNDFTIGQNDSMKKLILAQAYGDFLALDEKGRRVIKVSLSNEDSFNKFISDLQKTLN